MITKDEYVLKRVKMVVADATKRKKEIEPSTLNELMEQWDFDYDMEKEYRPEALMVNEAVVALETENFKEIPYTIEMDWNGGVVWLNNHVAKERLVVSKKDADSISTAFKLMDAKKKGMI